MTRDLIDRAAEMLKVAATYIRENYPDGSIQYDGLEGDEYCDGYCVADDCESAAEAIAALPALTVGVKPLVWRGDNHRVTASIAGRRRVLHRHDGDSWEDDEGDLHPTLDVAKAHVQAQEDARILAALDLTPAPVTERVISSARIRYEQLCANIIAGKASQQDAVDAIMHLCEGNERLVILLRKARAALTPTPVDDSQKPDPADLASPLPTLRYFTAQGETIQQMRDHAMQNPLFHCGDMELVWFNEGDLHLLTVAAINRMMSRMIGGGE